MEPSELEFLRELATDVLELAQAYASDPRAAALVEKINLRIEAIEDEDDEPAEPAP